MFSIADGGLFESHTLTGAHRLATGPGAPVPFTILGCHRLGQSSQCGSWQVTLPQLQHSLLIWRQIPHTGGLAMTNSFLSEALAGIEPACRLLRRRT